MLVPCSINTHTNMHTHYKTHFKPSSVRPQYYFCNERPVAELQVSLINTLNGTLYNAPCMQPAVNNGPRCVWVCVCIWQVLRNISDAVKLRVLGGTLRSLQWLAAYSRAKNNIHAAADWCFFFFYYRRGLASRQGSKFISTTVWKHTHTHTEQIKPSQSGVNRDVAACRLCLAICLWLWEALIVRSLFSFQTNVCHHLGFKPLNFPRSTITWEYLMTEEFHCTLTEYRESITYHWKISHE